MEKLENLEFRVCLVDLVPWVPLEIRVPWGIKELRDLLESRDHQAPGEILVRMEQQVSQDLLGRLDHLEREAWWVLLEPEDSKECQDHQERMENQAEMEQLECRDPQA